MDLGSILLGLALLLVVAFIVLRPILDRGRPPEVEPAAGGGELAVSREQVLTQLRDLDFDHTTGKINDEDYAAQRAQLVAQGVDILKAIDGESADALVAAAPEDDAIEAAIAKRRARRTAAPAPAATRCPNCQAAVSPGDRFCPKCGQALGAPRPTAKG